MKQIHSHSILGGESNLERLNGKMSGGFIHGIIQMLFLLASSVPQTGTGMGW